MDSIVIDEVIDAFQYQRLLRGETLFEEGDQGNAFYIVLSGKLKVMVNRPNAQLLPGDSFGEISLISSGARTASIKAIRDSELGRLDKSQFETLMQFHPEIAIEMLKVIAEWLDSKNQQISHTHTEVITLINVDVGSAKLHLGEKLAQALGGNEKVKFLSQTHWHQQTGLHGEDNPYQEQHFREDLLSRWISEQETAQHFVVLETSPLQSRWRDFCLRQADRILYVAQSSSSPDGLALKRMPSLSPDTIINLLLVHENQDNPPTHTQRWLTDFNVRDHYHLVLNNNESLRRLAREISGESVAVVLSGGGAHSFAQIGVLKALEAHGIKIDKIAGSGLGAILAAQYADGYTPDDMLALNIAAWQKHKPHKSYTLPVLSLLNGDTAMQLIWEIFGERHIDDLWLNFFCVSTDLTKMAPRIHKGGKIGAAVLASSAIPGVCSPVISDDGSMLIDGGILDNLPVRTMKNHHRGNIIAVDVSSNRGLQQNQKTTLPASGISALWQHINPLKTSPPPPNMFKLMAHAASLSSKINSEQSRADADLYLKPNCKGHGIMQMDNFDALARYGYNSTYENITSWLERNS